MLIVAGLEIIVAPPPWPEVLAVFAVRQSGSAESGSPAVLDAAQVEALRTVFWDMTKLTSEKKTVEHPASGSTAAWTEEVLSVTITPRTPDDMRVFYQFTAKQDQALDALLDNSELLASLAGDLTISSQAAKDLLAALPADLAPERRAVVQTACQLVGKVHYFWGGKSLKIGWDDRWGTLRQVTAAGSSTTGTYRPFGMDCSGFADWVFYNVSGGEYVIGHGGGAHAQHTYCTPISWEEALPGDLVFYPGDEHVGIVGRSGRGGGSPDRPLRQQRQQCGHHGEKWLYFHWQTCLLQRMNMGCGQKTRAPPFSRSHGAEGFRHGALGKRE